MTDTLEIARAAVKRKRGGPAWSTICLGYDAYELLRKAAESEGVSMSALASIAVHDGLAAAVAVVRRAKDEGANNG